MVDFEQNGPEGAEYTLGLNSGKPENLLTPRPRHEEIPLQGTLISFFNRRLMASTEGPMASFQNPLSLRLPGIFLFLTLISACSDAGTGPKKELRSLTGVWDAQSLTVPNPDNAAEEIDLVEEGGSYALSILSTGQYTAVFDLVVLQGFEAGVIHVFGDQSTLTPTSPPGTAMSGSWMLNGDQLMIDALREIDYDGDGFQEVVPIHLELTARTS